MIDLSLKAIGIKFVLYKSKPSKPITKWLPNELWIIISYYNGQVDNVDFPIVKFLKIYI